jgi:peptide/nickel transport system substrate-binding protein
MARETTGFYFFRIFLSLLIIALLIMLYWSSALLEKDVKGMRDQLNTLEKSLNELRTDINKVQNRQKPSEDKSTEIETANRPHVDQSLPNLLTEDPFYDHTLPKLLGPDFKPQGTFHSATIGKPDNLHPFSNWAGVAGWINQCTVAVARLKFGIYETTAPDMAFKMEERTNQKTKKQEFWVHLRDGVFWQPLEQAWLPEGVKLSEHFFKKHQVTAHDFKLFFDALMNPFFQDPGAISLRTYLGDIEEVEVVDDLTFIVRWKHEEVKQPDGTVVFKKKYIATSLTGSLKPLPSFVYKYFADGTKIVEDDAAPDTYRTNSVWAQNFSQHWAKNIIVSCGGWIFDGMTDRQIRFRRNPDHYAPLEVLTENSEVQFKDSPENIWTEFKTNKLETYEIRPDQLAELQSFLKTDAYKAQEKKGAAINRLNYVGRSYSYIAWNQARPFFKSRKVRQALAMAVDRKRIINQFLNGMAVETNGTFYRYSPAYDDTIPFWPYDPLQAKRMLEEEGWYDSTGSGTIDKLIDGERKPFKFSLTYYVKNPTSKVVCEYVATALKEIGITCELNGVDIADLSAVFDEKNFDALNLAWALGTPPEDPRQLWHSSGSKEKGSSNAIGFANAEADKIIEALQYESDPEKRIQLYHRFDAIIHEEAPYIFLYTPKNALLYRQRVQNVFIPAERQDLIPGANMGQPDGSAFWLKE